MAHLVHVHRALSGPGLVKAQRRAHFPAFAPALATAAAETDPATYGRVLKEWTDAVDHVPAGRDAAALAHRYPVFSELGDQCLFEGALPLAEGRLLKRRLTALVDFPLQRAALLAARRPARPRPPPSRAAQSPSLHCQLHHMTH